jgi:hypothetical protein
MVMEEDIMLQSLLKCCYAYSFLCKYKLTWAEPQNNISGQSGFSTTETHFSTVVIEIVASEV